MPMISKEVWFSHREKIFRIKEGRIEWTKEKKIWNWDHCTVSVVKIPQSQEESSQKKLRVVVRSNVNQNHASVKVNRPMTLRFMLGFDISIVHEIHSEAPPQAKNLEMGVEEWSDPRERWIFQLDENYWIWDWKEEGKDVTSTNVYKIREKIIRLLSNPDQASSSPIFDLMPGSLNDKMVLDYLKSPADEKIPSIRPLIYQPAVDGLKNFLREIHCCQKDIDDANSEVEVTLIFNNEQLRNHSPLDLPYRLIRQLLYNRFTDVETFKIRINRRDPSKNCFIFENIYSSDYGLNEDSIHGDPPSHGEVVHPISYYFVDCNHPVVFVNTSNHAMGEHDSNNMLWKWEYVPGVPDSPLVLGSKCRRDIDSEYNYRKIL
jgi:hypothetical protein